VPEPVPEPVVKLEDLVRVAAANHILPLTNDFRDDTRKLRSWARAVWGELTENGELDGLDDTFMEVLEEQALMAGYKPYEIKDVGLDSDWSKTLSDQKPEPTPSPCSEPESGTRRNWKRGEGDKPPGT